MGGLKGRKSWHARPFSVNQDQWCQTLYLGSQLTGIAKWLLSFTCCCAVSKGNRLKVRPYRMATAADWVVLKTCSNSRTAFHCVERNTMLGYGSVIQGPQVFPTRVSRVTASISLFSCSDCTHRQRAQGLLPRCSCRYRLFCWWRRNLLQLLFPALSWPLGCLRLSGRWYDAMKVKIKCPERWRLQVLDGPLRKFRRAGNEGTTASPRHVGLRSALSCPCCGAQ